MSSNYRAICLNHNPGIVLDAELGYDGTNNLASRDRLQGHEHCDIVVGRFSYPLVEVGCFGRQLPGATGCKGYHGGIEWIDRDWLRLLVAATATPDQIHPEILRPLIGRCWTPERLCSLHEHLELPEPTP